MNIVKAQTVEVTKWIYKLHFAVISMFKVPFAVITVFEGLKFALYGDYNLRTLRTEIRIL